MTFDQARNVVLALLRQQGKAKNSEMLARIGGDEAILSQVREDLLYEELAEDIRGAGLRYTGTDMKAVPEVVDGDAPVKLFLSYGRRDAVSLAERLERDLKAAGFDVWRDVREIKSGTDWQAEITDGLRSAQIVIALMTPHSTRTTRSVSNVDSLDSVCLGEIAHALFNPPSQPVVPVMAATCEPPLALFHLDYVDMRRWDDSEEQYQAGLARLVEGIAAARRGERRYRSWHHLLDPFDFAAFLHDKREGFTGRSWLFEVIDVWRTNPAGGRVLVLKGDPGTGKSAVVAELVHRNPGGQVLAYHCCQWDTPQTLEPARFVRSIAAMIAGKSEDYAAMLEDPSVREILSEESCGRDPASAFERGVLTPLERLPAPADGPRYVLIDALDEALALQGAATNLVQMLASRLNRLPAWLRLVVTTRKEPAVLELLKGLCGEEIEAESPQNLADLSCYIRGRLETAALAEQVRESKQHADGLTNQLVGLSRGNFLYARQALDGIAMGQHSLAHLDQLPPGLGGLYGQRFRWMFPDEAAFAPVAQVLAVICAAREPVDAALLASVTGLELETQVLRILVRLAAYVPRRRQADGAALYAAYHKSFTDWLTDPERLGQAHAISMRRGHEAIADCGWKAYQKGVANVSPYMLRHLVAHALRAGRVTEAREALLDLEFLEARNRAGLIYGIIEDLQMCREVMGSGPQKDAAEDLKLSLLAGALAANAPFISSHAEDYPQALFQAVWNHLPLDHDGAKGVAARVLNVLRSGFRRLSSARGEPTAQTEDPWLELLQTWRQERARRCGKFPWMKRRYEIPGISGATPDRYFMHPSKSPGLGRVVVNREHSLALVAAGPYDESAPIVSVHLTSGRVEMLPFEGGTRLVTAGDFLATTVGIESRLYSLTEKRLIGSHTGKWLAFDPTGRILCVGGLRVLTWLDTTDMSELQRMELDSYIEGMACLNDGRLVCATSGGHLAIVDRENSSVAQLPLPPGVKLRAGRWSDFCVSPDGKWAAVVCRRQSSSYADVVVVMDLATGESTLLDLQEASALAFSPDSRFLAGSAMANDGIRVWSVPGFEVHQQFEPNAICTYGLAFTPEGSLLSAGGDSRVYENTLVGGVFEDTLQGLEMLNISQDGEHLAVLGKDGAVCLYRLGERCEMLGEFRGESPYAKVGWMSSHWLITVDGTDVIRVWDCRTQALAAVVEGGQMMLHAEGMKDSECDELSQTFWKLMHKTKGQIALMGTNKELRDIKVWKLYGLSSSPDRIGTEMHHPDLGTVFSQERASDLSMAAVQSSTDKLVCALCFGHRISVVQFEAG